MPVVGVRVAAAVVALLAVGGCRAPSAPPPPNGTSVHEITVDGRVRTYRLYVPASLPAATPVPLVVMLHGGFGSGRQAQEAYGWDARADHGRFAVAYPDGRNRAWAVGGGCCGGPARERVDDVAFIRQMVTAIGRVVRVDPARVYATGMSNGAMMAYRLACDTDLFAAIAAVAGTLLGPCPTPAPISVLHVHGTADRRVRFDGGPGEGLARIDGPPVPDVVAVWRTAAACAAPAQSRSGPVTRWRAACPNGRTVELITIAGAGHQWPGASAAAAESPPDTDPADTDPAVPVLDATATIWEFFAAATR